MLLFGILSADIDPDDEFDSTTEVTYDPIRRAQPPIRTHITEVPTTASTPTTTTEDSWQYRQNYTQPIWISLHKYLCPFWADKQGFRSHRRTYGIALFPYMFCHYAMYCCYYLDDNMQLQPELPDVDLPPRDAVRRMANFKAENPFLEVWLVVRGPDSAFLKLLANANNEKATFQNNAVAWMKANDYDAIRMWWNNAPDSLNRSLAELYNDTNDVFMQHNKRTFGFLFPYGYYERASYNTSKLAHRRAYHTIVLYHEYPRNITDRKATTYTIRELKVYSKKLNQTDRPAFCHLYPLVALTYKIDPAKCDNDSSSKPYNIQPLGYGPPGPLTKKAGILSLPEVCDILDSSWNQTTVHADSAHFHPNYQFACKGEDAIAYTTGEDAYENILALDLEYEEEVFGVMNPEYDDFPDPTVNKPKLSGIYFHRLSASNNEISKLNDALEENTADDELKAEYVTAAEYNDQAISMLAEIRCKIAALERADSTAETAFQNPSPTVPHSMPRIGARLPNLDMPTFKGDIHKWAAFWEQFEQTVLLNNAISTTTKFFYLRHYLAGEAAATIAVLPTSEACYADAVELLKERFGDRKRIVEHHLTALRHLPHVKSGSDVRGLRQLNDAAQINIRCLTALSVPDVSFSAMLIDILQKALSYEIVLAYTRGKQSQTLREDGSDTNVSEPALAAATSETDLKELFMFTRVEVESREQCNTSPQRSVDDRAERTRGNSPASILHSASYSWNQCFFCRSKKHGTRACDANLSLVSKVALFRW
ncbi:hypothetical protein HPB49_016117 [Dermacentor silvarum]|uniref:Uncharacterized protein n=1 Tax=Dermacentor silvarum TaxID=543639 RepID=A0ACB8CY78_DERSI|nr:hypothetical protein HPB49_016117 [Dermacentor silvarum]